MAVADRQAKASQGDIPSRECEIGRRQGEGAPADAEKLVKYPG